jgi:hypothetical protein
MAEFLEALKFNASLVNQDMVQVITQSGPGNYIKKIKKFEFHQKLLVLNNLSNFSNFEKF